MLYNPFYEMERIGSLMNYLYSGNPGSMRSNREIEMANLYQNDSGYMLQFLAPGVKTEDVTVNFENGLVTVQLKRNSDISDKDFEALRRERSAFDYTRSYRLSDDADPEKIEAKILNGLLLIHIGKKEASKPKKITVNVH